MAKVCPADDSRRVSGRRPSCLGRLPRNRTCAVRIRLFGMTGNDPRHRRVYDLVVPSGNANCAGALMAAQIGPNRSSSVTSPRLGDIRVAKSSLDSRMVAQCPDGLMPFIDTLPRRLRPDAKPDEAAGGRSLGLPVLQHDRAQTSPNARVHSLKIALDTRRADPETPEPPLQIRIDLVDSRCQRPPRDRGASSRMRSRSRFSSPFYCRRRGTLFSLQPGGRLVPLRNGITARRFKKDGRGSAENAWSRSGHLREAAARSGAPA